MSHLARWMGQLFYGLVVMGLTIWCVTALMVGSVILWALVWGVLWR